MFRFEYRQVDHLPRLAWCARLKLRASAVVVEHGPWVEARPAFFFEGAWNGPFEDGGFDECDVVVGSGGRISPAGVIFVTPSHVLERLHTIRLGDELFVSNSLPYLLTVAGEDLRIDYPFYESDLLTILRGHRRAKTRLPTAPGRSVLLHYCGRVIVNPTLAIKRQEHRGLPRFRSYDDYLVYLRRMLRQVHANANSPLRGPRYQPLATISSGYDSAACAVLARELGCTTALSFTEARDYAMTAADHYDDSGRPIAERLGLKVREFQRTAYLDSTSCPEAEFLACGNGGDDIVMSALESDLPGTMLFTGFRGDRAWDAVAPPSATSLHHGAKDPSGGSLGEFRLRSGFVHVPVPGLTLPRHSDLFGISRSPEMSPWRLGNDYDRPIPRRLLESAGVPRGLFGQGKRAITQPFWMIGDNLRLYSPGSRADLLAYMNEAESARHGVRLRLHKLIGWVLLQIVWRVNRRLRRGNGRLRRVNLKLPQPYRLLLSETPLRFHWAIGRLKRRYASSSRR